VERKKKIWKKGRRGNKGDWERNKGEQKEELGGIGEEGRERWGEG